MCIWLIASFLYAVDFDCSHALLGNGRYSVVVCQTFVTHCVQALAAEYSARLFPAALLVQIGILLFKMPY